MSDPATSGAEREPATGTSAASPASTAEGRTSESPKTKSAPDRGASADQAPSSFGEGLSAAATGSKESGGGDGAEKAPSPWGSGSKGTRRKARRKTDSDDEGSSEERGEDEPKKPRRSRRRRKPAEGEAQDDQRDADGGEPEEGGRKKRRTRRRKKPVDDAEDAPREEAADDGESSGDGGEGEGDDGEPRKKRRRRGSRGGRRRKTKAEGDDETKDEESPDGGEPAEGGRKKRRSRRGRGSKRKDEGAPAAVEVIPGEEDDLPELADLPDEAELLSESKSKRRRKTKKKGGEKKSRERTSPKKAEPEVVREDLILVNAKDKLESRVAVVHGKRISDLSLEVNRVQAFVHNIYRGKVVNIEPAIGAAFVDFGQGKNGFLHVSDVLPEYGDKEWDLSKLLEAREGPNDDVDLSGVDTDLDDAPADAPDEEGDDDEEAPSDAAKSKRSKKGAAKKAKKGRGGRKERSRPKRRLEDLLKVGDKVVVQITKDAIGDKGPTLTTYISIPGRYLVLMPSLEMVGVSRKIEDEKERKRLRKIMQSFDVPGGMGLIVRTAGIGKTKADLRRDLEYLLALWDSFSKRLTHGKTPTPLYQENDLAIRTMRDLFSRRTKSVIVDDEEVCESMKEFARKLMPEHEERIVQHDGARPLFHHYGVEQDYEKIFSRRVELPSGGSIVIDQTEALVAIDVNSGRTRSEGAVFEDIALKTNLEALEEIALQIKLRDMGGILVLDFIDMMRKSNRLTVERALREALHDDRARHKVGRISQFGLLEMTRQRLGPGLSKLLYNNCQHCRGTGRLRSPEARAQGILRRLGSALTQKGFSRVEVRTQPEVVEYLERSCSRDLADLAKEHGRELALTKVPDQLEESVLRYLRADGREVRPGGRRKKR